MAPVGGVSHFGAGEGFLLSGGPPSASVIGVEPGEVAIQIEPQLLPFSLWQAPTTSFQYMSPEMGFERLSSTLYEIFVMYTYVASQTVLGVTEGLSFQGVRAVIVNGLEEAPSDVVAVMEMSSDDALKWLPVLVTVVVAPLVEESFTLLSF